MNTIVMLWNWIDSLFVCRCWGTGWWRIRRRNSSSRWLNLKWQGPYTWTGPPGRRAQVTTSPWSGSLSFPPSAVDVGTPARPTMASPTPPWSECVNDGGEMVFVVGINIKITNLFLFPIKWSMSTSYYQKFLWFGRKFKFLFDICMLRYFAFLYLIS